MKIPGPDHPIVIEPAPERVVVRAAGRVVADTKSALRLREASYPPVYYVPLADVDESVLRHSDTKTYCPFKGDASYYDIVADDAEVSDAIWTYQEPYPAVAEIAGHVAFYPHLVEISADAA
ncbi:MAG TPA: DUF427 domain-containing protein [Jatrophihabitans sp.]|nr:DUF427 domain-containing protein [Jatrophihabitans sp.]